MDKQQEFADPNGLTRRNASDLRKHRLAVLALDGS